MIFFLCILCIPGDGKASSKIGSHPEENDQEAPTEEVTQEDEVLEGQDQAEKRVSKGETLPGTVLYLVPF